MRNKIVVAYSGGLDTSVMVKWLSVNYDADIITYTADLGQKAELEGLEEKAKATGAVKCYIDNLQEEFVNDYIFPSIQARSLYEGEYPLATALGRPLIAKKLVEVAHKEGANMIAHGCTGKGNDQIRLEVGIHSLDPDIQILAPLREWEFKTREDEIDYALKHNIPVVATKESPYSIDENLWGTAIECGILEDPRQSPPEDVFQITKSPKDAPNIEENISIHFEKGVPVNVNDEITNPVEIINYLNKLGSQNGVGRVDLIENRVVGIKTREIYESPAATILHKAHHELEKLVIDKDTFRYKQNVSNDLSNLIYDGMWYSPLTQSLFTFIKSTQTAVNGTIKLKLYKGTLTIVSRESDNSLYNERLATYSTGDTFNHEAASGFLELYSLSQKTIAKMKKDTAKAGVV